MLLWYKNWGLMYCKLGLSSILFCFFKSYFIV